MCLSPRCSVPSLSQSEATPGPFAPTPGVSESSWKVGDAQASVISRTEIRGGLRGAWVAQSVKRPALDFSSGHDLAVHEIKPHVRLCTGSLEPAWDSLSPLSLCPSLTLNK